MCPVRHKSQVLIYTTVRGTQEWGRGRQQAALVLSDLTTGEYGKVGKLQIWRLKIRVSTTPLNMPELHCSVRTKMNPSYNGAIGRSEVQNHIKQMRSPKY